MNGPIAVPIFDTQMAYAAGYDAGRNGPDPHNCHFGIFFSEENTAAWEEGRAEAERTNLRYLAENREKP